MLRDLFHIVDQQYDVVLSNKKVTPEQVETVLKLLLRICKIEDSRREI
jgi:hypothetical protein